MNAPAPQQPDYHQVATLAEQTQAFLRRVRGERSWRLTRVDLAIRQAVLAARRLLKAGRWAIADGTAAATFEGAVAHLQAMHADIAAEQRGEADAAQALSAYERVLRDAPADVFAAAPPVDPQAQAARHARAHLAQLRAERQWRQTRVDLAQRTVDALRARVSQLPSLAAEQCRLELAAAERHAAQQQQDLDDHDAALAVALVAVATHDHATKEYTS